MTEKDQKVDFDIIVIGAGISGINTAYRLQTLCPHLTFTIFEARDKLGGTWDLFKYPGIRSDSDLYTFGFAWEHWTEPNPIAEGASILAYLNHCVRRHGIDKRIQFQTKVTHLNWTSSDQKWHATVTHTHNDITTTTLYRAQFIVMGTGYYDYNSPPSLHIPGLQTFQGEIIHPQFWPSTTNYTDKRISIVGSSATAVTLLPALAKTAKMVTQIQRSPTYYLVTPKLSPTNARLKRYLLSSRTAAQLIRVNAIVVTSLHYTLCRRFPSLMRRVLENKVRSLLPPNIPVTPHFHPLYNPWDQRLCLTPNDEFFTPFHANKASIVTGTIETITPTATGLRLQFGGGIQITVDSRLVKLADKFMWKGTMFNDVPNTFYMFGYANAAWTLGADNSVKLAIRLIRHVKRHGYTSATPRLSEAQEAELDRANVPLFPLRSGYVLDAMGREGRDRTMPRAGKEGCWRGKRNHLVDLWGARWGDVEAGLEFR